jgi:hypothetical protein
MMESQPNSAQTPEPAPPVADLDAEGADVVAAAAPPGSGVDLTHAAVVIDLFDRAAQANLDSPWRQGGTVHLPEQGRLIMTGDLHDHGLNFQRILKYADLHRRPDTHLVLHEIVHGPHRINGRDLSIRTLARVADLKLQFPDRVHILQANHELAQMHGEEISKAGVSVVKAFNDGVDFLYAEDADAVRAAMGRYIQSLLLAVRCPYGILCTHSLPSPRKLEEFDPGVIDRVPTEADLAINGSAYNLVWGRRHTQALADELSEAWGVEQFVMGHQPAEMGHEVEGDSMIVLNSDHDHGVLLPMDLTRPYRLYDLVGQIVPLAAVVL